MSTFQSLAKTHSGHSDSPIMRTNKPITRAPKGMANFWICEPPPDPSWGTPDRDIIIERSYMSIYINEFGPKAYAWKIKLTTWIVWYLPDRNQSHWLDSHSLARGFTQCVNCYVIHFLSDPINCAHRPLARNTCSIDAQSKLYSCNPLKM